MFRDFIDSLFSYYNDSLIIKSWKNSHKQKSDIFIEINGVIKGISIKKGMKNSFHVDRISDFIHFLIDNNIRRDIIIEYLSYHYADGTTNGKGQRRMSVSEYKLNYQEKIDKINNAFKENNIIEKAIDRFVIRGKNASYSIAAIICGEVDDFIWITSEDIREIVINKRDIYSSAVHFGPMTCQPKNRCLNYNPLYEKDRYCVQIKWYNLFDDIIENMNNKCIKN